jgi:putative FmdB family regulatory protein
MPIYEYRGPRCEERFEQLLPLRAEHPPVICPRCGAQEIRKLLSAFATSERSRATNHMPHVVTERAL